MAQKPKARRSQSRKAKTASANPGPIATAEEVQKANAGALDLLRAIWPLNLSGATDYVRRNPPDADAIAMLGFLAHRVLSSARARANAKKPRNSLRELMRQQGFSNYAEVREKAPDLAKMYGKETITQAISKAKATPNK